MSLVAWPCVGWACCIHAFTVQTVEVARAAPVGHLGPKPFPPGPRGMAATQAGFALKKEVKPGRLILNHFLTPPSDD